LKGIKYLKSEKGLMNLSRSFIWRGKNLKRFHYPDQPPELQDWLNLGGSLCGGSKDFDLLFSDRLLKN
jgi:hypothetical protein